MSETIKASSHRALQRARCGADRITETKRQRFLDMLAASCNVRMGDDNAPADVAELRELLGAWRDAKRSAWKALVGWLVRLASVLVLAGLAVKLGFGEWLK